MTDVAALGGGEQLIADVAALQAQTAALGRDMNAGWLVICGAISFPYSASPCLPSAARRASRTHTP